MSDRFAVHQFERDVGRTVTGGSIIEQSGDIRMIEICQNLTLVLKAENGGESQPIIVIAMANEPAGGIDQFAIQSLTRRVIQVVRSLVL